MRAEDRNSVDCQCEKRVLERVGQGQGPKRDLSIKTQVSDLYEVRSQGGEVKERARNGLEAREDRRVVGDDGADLTQAQGLVHHGGSQVDGQKDLAVSLFRNGRLCFTRTHSLRRSVLVRGSQRQGRDEPSRRPTLSHPPASESGAMREFQTREMTDAGVEAGRTGICTENGWVLRSSS